jgi:ABC-type sugar transport system ATPase subunit
VLAIESLEIPAGRATAVLGPNGAGKTTLLRLISGLSHPVAGSVHIGDHLVKPPHPAAEHVAFAFQQPVFVSGTVHDNLDLALRLRRLKTGDRRERIAGVAKDCEIAHLLGRPARHLSHGEAQRVNLARALALRAPVTLLDEPLAGLDPSLHSRLLEELPRLLTAWTTTVLFVTHHRDEALWLADHLVILSGGRLLASGTARELVTEPPDPETAKLLGYTVVELGGEIAGIPPGALQIGPGEPPFQMVVERVVDLGSHCEVVGAFGGAKARAICPEGYPLPAKGQRIGLRAERLVRFPR